MQKNKSYLMNLEEKYKKLKELLEQDEFPKEYLFKFIILTNPHKENEVKSCFDENAKFRFNKSKSNKYTTINILQEMASSQAVIDKYILVSKINDVIHL